MSHKRYEDLVLDDSNEIAEDIQTEETENSNEVGMIGVVTDCLRLNIRSEPSKEARIITVATCLDELMVYPEMSTDDWYAVCTAAGIEGFCMKKFVAIRQ